MNPASIPEMIFQIAEQYPDKPAFYMKKHQTYEPVTYAQFSDQLHLVAAALHQKGVTPGERIAILSENRIEWPLVDVAGMGLGAVTVPIYPTLTPNQIEFILQDAGVKGIFVSDSHQMEKILSIKSNLKRLQWIVTFESLHPDLDFVSDWEQFLESGQELYQQTPGFLKERIRTLDPLACTTIVYTSGTTGQPKGVMLTQRGFMHDIISAESVLHLNKDDIFLSFLPLSHLYERIAGHYTPIWKGAAIAYAESLEEVAKNIKEIRPTVLIAVPRFYEKIMNRIRENIFTGNFVKSWLGKISFTLGKIRFHGNPFSSRLIFPFFALFDILIFRKIRHNLGGRIRYLISGGAPLSPDVLSFFEIIGLPIVEGYGLTETHLIVTLTPYKKHKYGSCGKPIPGVSVKIAEDGEILVKGPTVMSGYYNLPDATREVIDEEGWFHTGDIGYLDEENYLFITGRKKHIIVTSGGKNISPGPVEDALKQSPYIQDAALIGNGRKFPLALIVPDVDALKQFAYEKGISFQDWEELITHPDIIHLYHQELESTQKHLARYEKAKQFILLDILPTVENGFLTPSLKLKKEKLEQHYMHQINKIYNRFK
jgi:long-chain acyl-CoA synthetase